MVERLKAIPAGLLERWNKFSSRQKTVIISVIGVVFFAVVILAYVLTKPQWEQLTVCDDTKQSSTIVKLLDDNAIKNQVSTDGLIISVQKEDYSDAILLLGANNVSSTSMSREDLLNNSMSTTQSDKALKEKLYTQDDLRISLLKINGIKDATVYIDAPSNDYTILSEEKETSVSAILTIEDSFTATTAESIANILASAVGNKNASAIKIIDQNGNLLFGGSTDLNSVGSINSNLEFKDKLTKSIENRITQLILKTGYDDVQVVGNLKFDLDKVESYQEEYTAANGLEQGLWSSSYNYTEAGTNASGGQEPGTGSNDGTSYMTTDGTESTSEKEITKYDYLPNKTQTNTVKEIGTLLPEQSSFGIVLTSYLVYKEEDLESQGLLDGTTFDEFRIQNDNRNTIQVAPEVLATVSTATGVAEANISIIAYEQPIFIAKEVEPPNVTNYLMIILAVLIIALLIFIVFKGTAPVEVTELEPELSVERLLAGTRENLSPEDIEFNEKSETRKMIEKFVEENPEAVASLLRNWLNDDWG